MSKEATVTPLQPVTRKPFTIEPTHVLMVLTLVAQAFDFFELRRKDRSAKDGKNARRDWALEKIAACKARQKSAISPEEHAELEMMIKVLIDMATAD
jgi:hypothetical protein